jgi:LysR family glycine cleavage system transcriptional activator
VQARHLIDSFGTPVMAPARLAADPITDPADLAGLTLLHEESRDGWSRWLAAAGVPESEPRRGPIYQDAMLTTHAAALGHGVALGDVFLNAEDIAAGRLARPFALSIPFGSYFLVAPDFSRLAPPARIFVEWLTGEVSAALREVGP